MTDRTRSIQMSKKFYILLLFIFSFIFQLPAYEIASMENPNYTYNDIVYAFYNQHNTLANGSRYFVVYDSSIYRDKDHNYYWRTYVDKKENLTNLVLWVDNGYMRITYYPRQTTFKTGSTWNLNNAFERMEFQNKFVQSLTSFFSSCQLEKKKYGNYFTKEETDAMLYCTNLFFGR